jgi:L-ascorbate metabolism protein UlaG (beta-lactamase superfamily)
VHDGRGGRADTVQAMQLRLIRSATLRLEVDGRHLLVDPMLDPAGARPPVEDTENDRGNPLVELPEPAELVVDGIDAVLLTHMHQDHFDQTARDLLPHDIPLVCQPEDVERLRAYGFADLRPVRDRVRLGETEILRTPARHGSGADAEALAPVCGFLLRDEAGRTLYLAGDTVLYEGVERVLDEHAPDVVVLNASGARFTGGDPIVMDAGDVAAVARRAPEARIVAVHLDAINHCLQTRSDLRRHLHDEGLLERVTIPEDGVAVPLG